MTGSPRNGRHTRSDSLRTPRDGLLVIAAAAFAANYLLKVVAAVVRAGGPVLVPGHALQMFAWLGLAAGFALAAGAFLGRPWARASLLRKGLRSIAAGFILLAAASALPPFSQFGQALASAGYLSARLLIVAGYLAWVAAALVAAGAYSRPRAGSDSNPARRQRLLGWAGAAFAVGTGLQLLSQVIAGWSTWTGVAAVSFPRVAGLFADALVLGAGVVATVALFEAGRTGRWPGEEPFACREQLLSVAAATLFLACALQAAATVSVLRLFSGTGWTSAAYYWLTWLSGLSLAVGPLAAMVGFALSARSLRARTGDG